MTLSIIIVSYNVREFLEQALLSLQKAAKHISHEIIVVDNASSDGTVQYIKNRFPSVKIIANDNNVGFARANNQAIQQSHGDFACLINPDTIVQEDTFSVLLAFFENHPRAGCVGCKILNPDGSLQLACRRSYPTPWVAFTKIIGLAKLFPKSRLFGRYNLTFLDEDKVAKVEAISGSFMMVRRDVLQRVGGLDESFFMYGEDLDWCYRIQEQGFGIYYVPDTQIIHFKGESSKKSPFQQRRLFYEAMRLFVQKHFKKGAAMLPSWILIIAIYASAVFSFISTAFQKLIWPLIDFLLMTGSLSAAIFIRFHPNFPLSPFILVHIVYSLVWMLCFSSLGLYARNRLSVAKAIIAVFVGLIINSALTFFFKQYGFSRAVVLLSGIFNILLLPGWRFVLNYMAHSGVTWLPQSIRNSLLRRQTIIVGDQTTSQRIISKFRRDVNGMYSIVGVVLTGSKFSQPKIENVPVVGVLEQLPEIIRREKVHDVIFSTDRLPYDKMLTAMADSQKSQINFKMVPSDIDVVIGKATTDYIEDIPFVDLEYKLHTGANPMLKRQFDFFLALLCLIVTGPVYLALKFFGVPLESHEILTRKKKTTTIKTFQSNRWWAVPLFPRILHGDMSFVGRDPFSSVTGENKISLSIKPGLTGLEHINKDHNLSKEERERFHLYYLKNYSLLLDMEILIKSVLNE